MKLPYKTWFLVSGLTLSTAFFVGCNSEEAATDAPATTAPSTETAPPVAPAVTKTEEPKKDDAPAAKPDEPKKEEAPAAVKPEEPKKEEAPAPKPEEKK